MRHDWILDVLNDLRAYAVRNDLPQTAAGAEALLRLARAEVAAQPADDGGGDDAQAGQGGTPPRGLSH
jgi:hypothetical protein